MSIGEFMITLEALTSLARCRRERLLREAAHRRLLRPRRSRPSLRAAVARALRVAGYVALSLGDAVADTR